MHKTLGTVFVGGVLGILLFAPALVFAQDYFLCSGPNPPSYCAGGGGDIDPCDRIYSSFDPGCIKLESRDDFIDFLLYALFFFRNVFWIIVVVMILWSAWLFVRSEGEPAKVEAARKTLTWTVVAIIVALIATSIPFIVASILR